MNLSGDPCPIKRRRLGFTRLDAMPSRRLYVSQVIHWQRLSGILILWAHKRALWMVAHMCIDPTAARRGAREFLDT
ncbi:MAG TPA: hypothetical protein VEY93_14985, partial [Longimicrobium sp.]|nr:hypothetical protein [Longimicrobium sp.]